MIHETSFSLFLRENRKQREYTLSEMADKTGISIGYYSDIENGRRSPPDREILDKMIVALHLNKTDRAILYDLAGKARSAAPPDLPDYINDHQVVRAALRLAREKANDDDWWRFIKGLERKEALQCSN